MSDFKTSDDTFVKIVGPVSHKLRSECDSFYPKSQTIFHYTTPSGFLGILKDGGFFATDPRFMNGEKEILYGYGIFTEELRKQAIQTESNVIKAFAGRALNTGNALDGMFKAYLTCFCSEGNLLSQWRAYGGTQGSFSIGLDMHDLNRISHSDPKHYLFPVLYDTKKQTEVSEIVVRKTITALRDLKEGDEVDSNNSRIAAVCRQFRSNIAEFLLRFKHPSFSSEQEWRMVYIADSNDENIKHRASLFGLTPYLKLKLSVFAGVNTEKLPVKGNLCRPKCLLKPC